MAATPSSDVTDAMIRAAEDRIGEMEIGQLSPFWQTLEAVIAGKLERLRAAREYHLRRVGRPAHYDEQTNRRSMPPSLVDLARQQAEIETFEWLLKAPKNIQAGARAELAGMEKIRQRAEA